MSTTRRETIAMAAAACLGCAAWPMEAMTEGGRPVRRFHYSVDGKMIDAEPTMLPYLRDAGVTDLWLGWWVGADQPAPEQFGAWRERIEAAGMAAHVITVPLGHPAEGPKAPKYPVDGHWGVRPDGSTFGGTALHPPVLRENLRDMPVLRREGFSRFFVDDDFRLAQTPFDIGGCFCPEHRAAFLRSRGYAETRWQELVEHVGARRASPIVREWLGFSGDELTDAFHQIRRACGSRTSLGIMVMFLGCERAGIRLPDYRNVPFRVGELMFEDASFAPVKGKTDELFSVLLHRRFARPELAYSETTAYPPERLSPRNGAAKLCTSTIADVRNTMMMCMNLADWNRREPGLMAAAMKKHAALHAKVAGHRLRGPLKHFYGEHSRFVGGDWPYSLFMAMGVPFEVVERPGRDGWTFLSDADARALANGELKSAGTAFVYRPDAASTVAGRAIPETLADLFALRREMLPRLGRTPYVEQEEPVVCAWYPTAGAALLWNLQERPVEVTLRLGAMRRPVRLAALDMEIVEDVQAG